MQSKRLYSQEVIPNILELIKDCKGTYPSSNDPVVFVCFRSYAKDYRWKLVELDPNRINHPFAFDDIGNRYVGSGAYRDDLFERIGVLGPEKNLARPEINIDKGEE